ncbi:mg749 protein [Tupanvirus deep ocean]|uniref:Mg749 protein n=2 Tax=Tupanvirus TaxID=2094720 RepID=A0AC62A6Z3_9VIRU|nr:mg749 protein [Tupanvirus deep ocean]QKU33465.1 mg749 protein [Tupanvirus deep ocean]
MSAKKRCFNYCNDCVNGKSQWKIVEVDSSDAEWHKLKKEHCVPCEPKPCFEKPVCEKEKKKPCPEKKIKCCKGEKGEKGERGSAANYACTLISVKNPDSQLIIPEAPVTPAAILPAAIVGEAVDLTGWTDIVPDALNAFDNATGTYTAPETGDYQVSLVVNYETSVPLNVTPTLNDVPIIELYDVATDAHIVGSQFPTINIVVTIPPFSSGEPPIDVAVVTIIAKAQVIINAVIPLVAGQRIRFRAVTNGLVYNPPIGVGVQQIIPPLPPRIDFSPENGSDTTLSIYKLRNSPIVTINCNN